MPVTADLGGKNYTLGRGRVFFDRFAPNAVINALTRGSGERYIGNTPEFLTNSESENLDHFDSDQGVRTKDDSVQLTLNRAGSFVTDHISSDNIALNFLGEASTLTQAAATGVIDTVPGVRRGRFIQLGVTASNPSGVRNVSNVVVKNGVAFADTVTASGNYQVDEVRGRVWIEANSADINDDEALQFTYDVGASTRSRIISGSQSIYGALRFVADNPKGANLDYFWPYVKLAPDGDFNLKGDEWQQIGFTFEVLKKASNVESVYVDGQPVVTP